MPKRIVLTVMMLLLAGLTAAAVRQASQTVLRVEDRKRISFASLLAELGGADVLFIGELHDAPDHHRMQLDVIRGLHEAGVSFALGLEMFRAEDQRTLDQWVAGDLALRNFQRFYYESWRFPWPLYDDILLYAREHGIPLIGLNVPSRITQKVAREGFSSLSSRDLQSLPPGISCDVDEAYLQFIRRSHALPGHGGKSFRFFCEAQLVWDKAMAKHLVDFRKRNPDLAVVVLAGGGHAWKRGIPSQVRQLAPELSFRVIMPLIDGKIEEQTVTTVDADYVLL